LNETTNERECAQCPTGGGARARAGVKQKTTGLPRRTLGTAHFLLETMLRGS
jgi:hypothetical protein